MSKISLIGFLTSALTALISISNKILKDVNKLNYKALSIFVCILNEFKSSVSLSLSRFILHEQKLDTYTSILLIANF